MAICFVLFCFVCDKRAGVLMFWQENRLPINTLPMRVRDFGSGLFDAKRCWGGGGAKKEVPASIH